MTNFYQNKVVDMAYDGCSLAEEKIRQIEPQLAEVGRTLRSIFESVDINLPEQGITIETSIPRIAEGEIAKPCRPTCIVIDGVIVCYYDCT